MKIRVGAKRWATVAQKRSFERLAKRVMDHYPKDIELHKAVSGALKSMDQAASKLSKSASKAKPKRKVAKRKAVRRTAKRRTARKSAPKRRRAAKRRTTAKRSRKASPKRRGMRRRAA